MNCTSPISAKRLRRPQNSNRTVPQVTVMKKLENILENPRQTKPFPKLSPNNQFPRRRKPTQSVPTPSSHQNGGENNPFGRLAFDMINWKRFPGVLFRFKTELGVLLLIAVSVVYFMHRWGLVCTNYEIKREIDRLCKLYKAGVAVGNLCSPLCETNEIHSISCISRHSKKQFVFTAKWNKRLMVIKSSRTRERLNTRTTHQNQTRKRLLKENLPKFFAQLSQRNPRPKKEDSEPEDDETSEKIFENTIRKIANDKLNVTLSRVQLDEVKFLEVKNTDAGDLERRKTERQNVLALLQSQEYLLLRMFADRDIFPKVLGTCGHLYAVEYLERPSYNSLFTLDDKSEWSERMKLAISIMDFVEEVENNFPDALYLCEVKMNHLGVAPSGRVKFLDLDWTFTKSKMDTTLRSGNQCQEHKDCDFMDCKSTCNPDKKICDAGIANDNLQMFCEKIFIGWTMSGKMIIPGLLMSEYTPASLSALLRLCAENGRQPVHEDLRQRLYTTLTEMHQILVQKLSPE